MVGCKLKETITAATIKLGLLAVGVEGLENIITFMAFLTYTYLFRCLFYSRESTFQRERGICPSRKKLISKKQIITMM